MKTTFSSESVIDTFSFPFEDPQWVSKLGTAGVLMLLNFLVPIIPTIFVMGYSARIMKSVIEGGQSYLPEWNDWGGDFKRGLRVWGAQMLVMLPMFILVFGGMGLMMPSIFLIQNAAISGTDQMPAASFFSIAGMLLGGGMMTIGFLIAFVVSVLAPVVEAHVVSKESFAAVFDVKGWWAVFQRNWLGFIVAYLVYMAVGMAFAFASQILMFTIILACLFPLVLFAEMAYILPVHAALYGQVYRDGIEVQTQNL